MRAARLAWALFRPENPDGLVVRHRCDNPPCCNPNHLELGTIADNNRDTVERGRTAKGERNVLRMHPERAASGERNGAYTHPEKRPRGEHHGCAKLNPDTVDAIRAARMAGESQRAISSRFRLSQSTISRIVNGKAWKHLRVDTPGERADAIERGAHGGGRE